MATLTTRTSKGSALTWAEMDGNLTEVERRSGKGWNDLVQDVTVRSGANAPTLTLFRDGIYDWAFSESVMNECFANFHINHDYDVTGGTTAGMVYPHIHFSTNTTSTGTVRFGVEWTAARRKEGGQTNTKFGATQILYFEQAITASDDYEHFVTEAADGFGIPAGGVLWVDGIIKCRFFRDATHINDTYPDPVFLNTVDIHYPCDVDNTPNRTFPFV